MSINPFLSFRGAKHPQGVRRIRKAAKLPTAAQPVTEGFRPHVPKPSPGGRCPRRGRMRGTPKGFERLRGNVFSLPPFQGEGGPQGRMRVGIVGCGGHRTGGWGHPPLRRVTIDFVGAAVPSGPSITGAPPWSPSSVMGFAHATFSPAGRRLWPFRQEHSDVDGVPLIRHGCAMPPSPMGRLFVSYPRSRCRGGYYPPGIPLLCCCS